MEITLTAEQASTLADLTNEHPNRVVVQLRDRATILAEFGAEAVIIKPDASPEDAA
ncbi:MAG: hypothetical protein HUU17_06050 [Chthonomonadales bacterium]|nr:hypothetical protein [Chthonomonadales bacterium]